MQNSILNYIKRSNMIRADSGWTKEVLERIPGGTGEEPEQVGVAVTL
jgi:hypothetical protein